jgi:transmembrane sensor
VADRRKQHLASISAVEAVDWLIRLTEMASESENTTATRQQTLDNFNLWATRSPANLRSFLEIVCVFEALGECETQLIQELVAHVARNSLEEPPAHVAARRKRVKVFWGVARTLAATVLLVTAGALFWRWTEGTTYITQPGEWHRIRLQDGSVVFLRENSQMRVSFDNACRTIRLRAGHAVFDVAKDPRRPFWVMTPDAEIQALGTRFDVDYRDGPTRVTVVDGSVNVRSSLEAPQPGLTRTISAEQGVEVLPHKIVVLDKSQVENVLMSQRDVLVFEHEPLSVVAERLNFSTRRQLRFADPGAAQRPISGRYITDHPEGLVLAIKDIYPDLEIRETDGGWVVALNSAATQTR